MTEKRDRTNATFVENEAPEIITDVRWVGLRPGALLAGALLDWAIVPGCGAVVSFIGTVRSSSADVSDVIGIEYEAFVCEALTRLAEVADQAVSRWPTVGRIAMLHRYGEVQLGEAAVIVIVSAPHRPEAFSAARFCIDVLKNSVPIWKLERSACDARWSEAGVLVESVEDAARNWDRRHLGVRVVPGEGRRETVDLEY